MPLASEWIIFFDHLIIPKCIFRECTICSCYTPYQDPFKSNKGNNNKIQAKKYFRMQTVSSNIIGFDHIFFFLIHVQMVDYKQFYVILTNFILLIFDWMEMWEGCGGGEKWLGWLLCDLDGLAHQFNQSKFIFNVCIIIKFC